MHRTASIRRHRRTLSRGFVAVVPLAIAVFSSVLLMTACHSTPMQLEAAPAEPAATMPAGSAASARNPCYVEQATLSSMLYDEHFYTPSATDDDASPD
jgi:hypothetical protein